MPVLKLVLYVMSRSAAFCLRGPFLFWLVIAAFRVYVQFAGSQSFAFQFAIVLRTVVIVAVFQLAIVVLWVVTVAFLLAVVALWVVVAVFQLVVVIVLRVAMMIA